MGIFCVVTSNNFFLFYLFRLEIVIIQQFYPQSRPPFVILQFEPTMVLNEKKNLRKGREVNRYLLKYSVTE